MDVIPSLTVLAPIAPPAGAVLPLPGPEAGFAALVARATQNMVPGAAGIGADPAPVAAGDVAAPVPAIEGPAMPAAMPATAAGSAAIVLATAAPADDAPPGMGEPITPEPPAHGTAAAISQAEAMLPAPAPPPHDGILADTDGEESDRPAGNDARSAPTTEDTTALGVPAYLAAPAATPRPPATEPAAAVRAVPVVASSRVTEAPPATAASREPAPPERPPMPATRPGSELPEAATAQDAAPVTPPAPAHVDTSPIPTAPRRVAAAASPEAAASPVAITPSVSPPLPAPPSPTAAAAAPPSATPPVRQIAPVLVAVAIAGGTARLSVTLEPAELGRVEISVERHGDATEVRVIAERPETLALIQRDQRELDRTLSQAGIGSEGRSLSFSLSDGGTGGFAEQRDGEAQRMARGLRAVPGATAEVTAPPPRRLLSLIDLAV